MIVVDTNIIAYATLIGDFTPTVIQLHEADPVWEVPVVWRSEYLNVVSLYLRKGLINLSQAIEVVESATSFVGGREHVISQYAVLELVNKSKCSSYDCEFVSLAEKLNTPLVTYDKQILREFKSIAMRPEDYLSQNTK